MERQINVTITRVIENCQALKSCLYPNISSSNRKGQQYDCKWYIPLADLTFQTIEDCESTPIPLVQDEEIDAMKIKISQIKNEIQREKVGDTEQ